MGVTGLETAFAVLYTDLVLPGVLRSTCWSSGMTAGGGPYGLRAADAREGRAGEPVPGRPRRPLDGGRGRIRVALGQLLLRRPRAAGPGADDGRRRRRSPTASGASRSGWPTTRACMPGRAREARPLARRARGGGRPGGVSPGRARLRAGGGATSPCSCRARACSGCRRSSPSSTRRAWGARCRRWPSTSSRSSRSRRSASAPSQADGFSRALQDGAARPGAAVRHRVARLREPDRRGPARRRRRGPRRAGRGHLAHRGQPRARPAQDGALGRDGDERRDGAVRAAARRPARRSSRKCRRSIK